MTKAVTRAIPEKFTPRALAAFIANLIRTDSRWWNQGMWLGWWHDNEGTTLTEMRDQLARDNWHCGSTGCVAGWATILTAPAGAFAVGDWIRAADGHSLGHVKALGQEALGLSKGAATWLFDGNRTESQVLAALDIIAGHGAFSVSDIWDAEW